jgi:hypothetical protein
VDRARIGQEEIVVPTLAGPELRLISKPRNGAPEEKSS